VFIKIEIKFLHILMDRLSLAKKVVMPIYTLLCSSDNREFINFEVADPPLQITFPFDNNNLTMKLFWFGSPSFMVEVDSDQDVADIGRLADIVTHTLAGLYDAVGLSTGRPCAVRLEGISVAGSRIFAKFTLGLPNFSDAIMAAGLSLHDWISLCVGSPQLRAGLRDLRLGMQTPGEAAVHCFRAIERIRQSFITEDNNRKKTWDRLRESLNINRSWLDTYIAHATAVRHGELIELQLEDRNRCFAQAATVIIRYAAYLKGGKEVLSASVFPVLI
jgi:hypothetical protein